MQPNGGKWWRFKYRFDGKEKLPALGVYPEIGLEDARERRDNGRRLVAHGVDPSEARKAEKVSSAKEAADTFEAIAREWHARHNVLR